MIRFFIAGVIGGGNYVLTAKPANRLRQQKSSGVDVEFGRFRNESVVNLCHCSERISYQKTLLISKSEQSQHFETENRILL